MPKISFAGSGGLLWIAAALIMFFQKSYRAGALILLCGLLAGVVVCNLLLKNIFTRKRPCWIRDYISIKVNMPKDYSFPSGHTMSSFIAAEILIQISFPAGCFAVAAASLIGFSRLYLYVHFPTDVILGAVMGIILGMLVWNHAELIEPVIRYFS